MSLSREAVELMLVRSVGPLMEEADMEITTGGVNPSLNGPIGIGIRALGFTVLDITTIVDADVAQVTPASYDEFLNIAMLALLEDVLGNLTLVDITVGPRSEKLSQLRDQVQSKIDRLRAKLGYDVPQMVKQLVTIDFAEHND